MHNIFDGLRGSFHTSLSYHVKTAGPTFQNCATTFTSIQCKELLVWKEMVCCEKKIVLTWERLYWVCDSLDPPRSSVWEGTILNPNCWLWQITKAKGSQCTANKYSEKTNPCHEHTSTGTTRNWLWLTNRNGTFKLLFCSRFYALNFNIGLWEISITHSITIKEDSYMKGRTQKLVEQFKINMYSFAKLWSQKLTFQGCNYFQWHNAQLTPNVT